MNNRKQYAITLNTSITEEARALALQRGLSFSKLVELLLRTYIKRDNEIIIR